MKIHSRVSILLATVLFSVGSAADVAKIELRADSVKAEGAKMIGKGSAVVVAGDTTISAEHIIVDNDSGEIKCVGDAVIKIAQLTISAKDAKIDTRAPRAATSPQRLREIRDLPTSNVRF